MINFMQSKPMDKADDLKGTGSGKAPEPEAKPAAATPEADGKKVEAQGDNVDDFGYAKEPEATGDPTKETKLDPKPPVKEDVKIDVKATGYGDEPPKIEEEVKPPVEIKDADLGFELKVDEVIPKEELTKVKDFAKKHSLTKEAAQAYLDLRANEVKESARVEAETVKNFEKQKLQQRSEWHKELKNDPHFGGEKFSHNVLQAEKVLQEFMPLTKKSLTERGSVLPPYVMRDLAKLGDHLYSTEKLTQGEAIVPPVEVEEDDGLGFYR